MYTAASSYVALNSQGAEITWKPSRATDLAGYNILVSNRQEGPYTNLNKNLITSTKFTTPELRYGCYYFIVTAVDKRGNTSITSEPTKLDIK